MIAIRIHTILTLATVTQIPMDIKKVSSKSSNLPSMFFLPELCQEELHRLFISHVVLNGIPHEMNEKRGIDEKMGHCGDTFTSAKYSVKSRRDSVHNA